MTTASIVTYDHHLLDIEPVLRSLFASPIDIVWVIDHSEHMLELEEELNEFTGRVLAGEPLLQEKVARGFRVIYMRHENNGYGGGHNVALKEATRLGSSYHLVVNPDIWFGPKVIPTIKQYMDLHHDVAQIMPKVLYPNGQVQRLAKMLPTPMDMFGRLCLPLPLIEKRNHRFELRDSDYRMTLNVPYLSGCFMFFRMSAIESIDYFDEHFFMYAEDIDITRRLHRNYQTLYLPEIPVYHKFSRASRRELWLFWVHIRNIIMYFNKWGWFSDKERTEFNNRLQQQIDEGGIKCDAHA